MVTFTTLAESKWAELLSQHCSAWPGSSTPIATADTRSRRAWSMSWSSLVASEWCVDDLQLTEAAALAGEARSGTGTMPSRTVATAVTNPRLRFIAVLRGRWQTSDPGEGCAPAEDR